MHTSLTTWDIDSQVESIIATNKDGIDARRTGWNRGRAVRSRRFADPEVLTAGCEGRKMDVGTGMDGHEAEVLGS